MSVDMGPRLRGDDSNISNTNEETPKDPS